MTKSTYTLDVHKRSRLVVDQLGSEFGTLIWVAPHNVLKQANIVRGVPNLLSVQQDLLRLAHLGKTRNDLVGNIRAEVYAQCHSDIGHPNHITKLLAACQFAFLQPLLKQVLLSLL